MTPCPPEHIYPDRRGIDKPPAEGYAAPETRKSPAKGTTMKRRTPALITLLAALLLIAACDTALTVGRRTVGFRSGEIGRASWRGRV